MSIRILDNGFKNNIVFSSGTRFQCLSNCSSKEEIRYLNRKIMLNCLNFYYIKSIFNIRFSFLSCACFASERKAIFLFMQKEIVFITNENLAQDFKYYIKDKI